MFFARSYEFLHITGTVSHNSHDYYLNGVFILKIMATMWMHYAKFYTLYSN